MSRKFVYFIISALVATVVVSCNKKSDDETDEISMSNAAVVVSSFSISKNVRVLRGIDSVFFSIDLDKALIFNADSLPYGTHVNKLVPIIATNGCSAAELTVKRAGLPDTTYNYLTNSTDTIDFSNPVKLHIVALDGVTSRDYTIMVNVHKMKPDSLYWDRTARRALPSSFGIPAEQKTIAYKGSVYCLTARGGEYSLARTDNPANEWEITAATFPFTPDTRSFNASTTSLYILDTDGNLWASADAASWSATGVKMISVYGGYGDQLIGVTSVDGTYRHLLYPSMKASDVPEGCPVSGTSQIVTFNNEWAIAPQAFVIGGRTADGELTGHMWGYDGERWARISSKSTPAAEGKTFFTYTTFLTDTNNLAVSAYPTLFCIGGRGADNKNIHSVYISRDMGINWHQGDDLVQLPSYVPPMAYCQAVVGSSIIYARSASAWEEMAPIALPAWCAIAAPLPSRATKPIDEWECPYVYLFGGVSDSGALYNTVWRGVINRLTFQPLQ